MRYINWRLLLLLLYYQSKDCDRQVDTTPILLESWSSSFLTGHHWHQHSSLNSFTGCPLNGESRFKLAILTFKALHTGRLSHLANLLQYHKPARSTSSSVSHLLSLPQHNLSFGSCAFQIAEPKITHYLLTFWSAKHSPLSDVIWRPTTFSQPILPPSADP